LIVDLIGGSDNREGLAKLIARRSVHPNQESTAVPFAASPTFNIAIEPPPTAKVKVTYAEVGAVRDFESLL